MYLRNRHGYKTQGSFVILKLQNALNIYLYNLLCNIFKHFQSIKYLLITYFCICSTSNNYKFILNSLIYYVRNVL
jgi:hypothetical protein